MSRGGDTYSVHGYDVEYEQRELVSVFRGEVDYAGQGRLVSYR